MYTKIKIWYQLDNENGKPWLSKATVEHRYQLTFGPRLGGRRPFHIRRRQNYRWCNIFCLSRTCAYSDDKANGNCKQAHGELHLCFLLCELSRPELTNGSDLWHKRAQHLDAALNVVPDGTPDMKHRHDFSHVLYSNSLSSHSAEWSCPYHLLHQFHAVRCLHLEILR